MNSLHKILVSKNTSCKSIWFMRQAGRYLPEFRKIRSQNQDFIKLCLNSELSSKITLQPIKRFDVDSAIIFSDILMVPYALGQEVKFVTNQGPKLSNFNVEKFLDNNEIEFTKKLNSVYKAIEKTRKALDNKKSLISFVGAPWTLMVYMLGFKKNKNVINFNQSIKEKFNLDLIQDKLVKVLCTHIEKQINAGADVVQIFDSWAGLLPADSTKKHCFIPNAKIVEFCKHKKIPTICFPRGLKESYEEFNKLVKPDGLNIDYELEIKWAKKHLKNVVLQGGLDPKFLLKPEKEMLNEASKYIKTFKDIPYIFNLGHGLLPETEPDKVSRLIKFYRDYR